MIRICGLERSGWGTRYRVARGFEETWGRERNSSRSMVPELSFMRNYSAIASGVGVGGELDTLSSFIKRFLNLSTSSRSTFAHR